MFGTLLESRARRRRRPGGAAVSVAVHMVIIGAITARTVHGRPSRRRSRSPSCFISTDQRRRPPWPYSHPSDRGARLHHDRHQFRFAASTPRRRFRSTCRRSIRRSAGARTASSSVMAARVPDWRTRSSMEEAGTSRANGVGVDLQTRILASGKPRYPESLRQAAIDGRVLVRFAVDTVGRIDMSSVTVLASTHDLFTRAVRDALPCFASSRPSGRTSRARARRDALRVSDHEVAATSARPRATSRRASGPS